MNKTKYVQPIMRFNPGTQKYEPELPIERHAKGFLDARVVMLQFIMALAWIVLILVFFFLLFKS